MMHNLIDLSRSTNPQQPHAAVTNCPILILGVGNVLMGDEGVGIHALRKLEATPFPDCVRLLDGGTGGINLLLEFDDVRDIILIDATRDGRPAGTLTFLRPHHAGDLPRGLGAHDFGLKDLFAVSALTDVGMPNIHLFTISVEHIEPMSMDLSPAVAAALPELERAVRELAARLIAP